MKLRAWHLPLFIFIINYSTPILSAAKLPLKLASLLKNVCESSKMAHQAQLITKNSFNGILGGLVGAGTGIPLSFLITTGYNATHNNTLSKGIVSNGILGICNGSLLGSYILGGRYGLRAWLLTLLASIASMGKKH